MADPAPRRRAVAADAAWTLALTFLVLGPLLTSGGYWLFGDMVFVPRQPWKDAWLGLDGALPRAVPMDAVVSALTSVVPGSVVQRVFLVGAFLLGGTGVARLVGDHAWYARAAAVALFLWNPWVHEHLHLGQWAITAGYLLLPWVALAARRLREEGLRAGLAPAAVALVATALCSPSSGVTAVVVLAVLGLRRRLRDWVAVGTVAVVANLPWVLPSLVASTAEVTTDGVFDLFAARAESGAGVLPSLLSLGGTWKTSIVAGERTSAFVVVASCALTAVALAGLLHERRTGRRGEVGRLTVLAAGSLVVAALPTVGAGADLLEVLGDRLAPVALLRDSHRFLAPAALALAVGAAAAATWLRARVAPGREAVWALVGLVVVAPVVLLPSLLWGAGELRTADYPQEWDDVAGLVEDEHTTVVLPWAGSYRGFDWNHRRAVLDPAPRYLRGEVLVDDRTFVEGEAVPSEDPRVAAVTAALAAPTAEDAASRLRALGVRWVLVELGQPSGRVPAGTVVHQGPGLRLVDLSGGGGVVADADRAEGPGDRKDYRWVVIAGHVSVSVLLATSAAWILRLGVKTVTLRDRSAKSLGGD